MLGSGTVESFAARLSAITEERGRLCVGIDPHPYLLNQWGLPDTPEGCAQFCRALLRAGENLVGVYKPQSAFFERYGSAGIAVLEDTLAQIRDAGALSILDAKRGDLGSTMQGYAEAYLHPGARGEADALTVHPYMGVGSLDPAFEAAIRYGKGLFVLALTSNPEGAQVQTASGDHGREVAVTVCTAVANYNREHLGPTSQRVRGSFGVVVGPQTSHAKLIEEMGLAEMGGPILVPGFGAQGGTGADIRSLFAEVKGRVLINSSRAIASVGPQISDIRVMIEKSRAQVEAALA